MKTISALLVVILLVPHAPARECGPDTKFDSLKNAVRTMALERMSISFEEKLINRAGDTAAWALLRTIPEPELTSSNNVEGVLSVLHSAFECTRCISLADDRQPRLTLLVLEHLRNRATEQIQIKIDETRNYVLQQTRTAR